MLHQSTLIQVNAHVQQSIFAHALFSHIFTFVEGTTFVFVRYLTSQIWLITVQRLGATLTNERQN
jgi:hypothetical protein